MAVRHYYRGYSLVFLIYILIGIFVAFDRHYVNVSLLKAILSAVLAILLWFLILLGVDLHVH
jgi:hypothetical protein